VSLGSNRPTNIKPKFTIAKKYNKYLIVDKSGKLIPIREYHNGKKYIKVTVKAGSKKRTVKVKVKK
jgi:hypothetical protein